MKYLVLCFFTIFITSNIFSQNLDTTEWIDFKSSDSRFMLKYPSYFKIANWGDRNDDCNSIIDLNYTEYTPLDPNIKSDSVEYPSILSIFTCKKSFNTIAQESEFFEKNGFWYGDNHRIPVADNNDEFELDAGFAIRFDDWYGIKVIKDTRIYLKHGGCLTAAGEGYKFILYKEISKDEFLYAKGYGFSFPQGSKILKEICRSIQIINDTFDRIDEEYKLADQELNRVYKRILEEYKSDSEFIEKLRNTQRIWIQFRDAELAMRFPAKDPSYYGSLYSQCFAYYLTILTKERTETLKEWIEGTEEGDVCSGSVRINY